MLTKGSGLDLVTWRKGREAVAAGGSGAGGGGGGGGAVGRLCIV